MDADADKVRAEEAFRVIEDWRTNLVTIEVLRAQEEQEKGLLNMLVQDPVSDLESLVNLLEMRGHIRGLRASRAIIAERLEELQQDIENGSN